MVQKMSICKLMHVLMLNFIHRHIFILLFYCSFLFYLLLFHLLQTLFLLVSHSLLSIRVSFFLFVLIFFTIIISRTYHPAHTSLPFVFFDFTHALFWLSHIYRIFIVFVYLDLSLFNYLI